MQGCGPRPYKEVLPSLGKALGVHLRSVQGNAAGLSWSWNWMEPPLGTISFFLLCVQYARNQITNIGASQSPYQAFLYRIRRNKLSKLYPQYDRSILNNFCETLNYTHLDRDDGLDDGFSLGSSGGDIGMSAARTSAI